MRVDALEYELPPELIAQRPEVERDRARLMVVSPSGVVEHRRVADLPDLVPTGALIVVNDTRVIPARLIARKRETGGKVEVLLLRRVGSREINLGEGDPRAVEIWRALGKASKALRFGADLDVWAREANAGPPVLTVRLLGRTDDGLLEVAVWTSGANGYGQVGEALRAAGHVPLPPYIKRDDEPEDADRYQTVYARHDGAVAAPTAGLHLTNGLLGRLAVRGCEICSVTLHVGLGTFHPVQVEDLDAHPMHSEPFTITPSAADAIARARSRGAPVVAIGTTTARALESAADPQARGQVRACSAETRLLVQPGYSWQVVDVLFTNFHLPRSTLLAMACSFGGTETVLGAYRTAVREGYRFFSYGDAMLLRRAG